MPHHAAAEDPHPIGNVNGARFSFYGAEDPSSYLTVGDLQMGPGTTSAVVLGRLAGTIEGRPATIRFDVTADAPFENRPPYLDPTAPAEIVTQCVANVPIEPGLTDVDGDVIATWAEIDGHGIGGTTAPVVLPLGVHVVTVGAEDRYSALGLGNVSVHVVSDGTVPLEPGTELLELAVPRGTVGSQFALVASETLTLMPNVSVTAGAVGGPVASLGDLELAVGASTGEAWVDDDASLANRARIRGALHLGGDLSATSSAVIEGAVTHDGPFTPHETLRVVIPVAGVGPDVHLGPGEEAVLSTGAHGVVELGPRARLVLAHGMHTVRSLSVSPNAEIVVAGDATVPTIVRVEEGFSWHGSAVSETGPALVVVLMSADSVQVHSTFEGWLVAPTAEVVLLPGASPHRGGVFARSIRVQPNVLVERVAMDFALPPNVLDACALTPILRCIRDNPDGSATARFGYSSLLPHIGAVVALGPANRIHPELSPSVDHQAFLPVGDDVAFEVTFTDEVRWILGSRSAVATRESPRCP